MIFALLIINNVDISSLVMRGKVLKTNNVGTRPLYSAVSFIILIIIYRRIFLIVALFFNSSMIIE